MKIRGENIRKILGRKSNNISKKNQHGDKKVGNSQQIMLRIFYYKNDRSTK